MAWTRTSLAVLANGALLLLRDINADAGPLQLVAVGGAAALALSTFLIGVNRQRVLARRPLPARVSPWREVYLTGVSILALILISELSLMI